MSTGIPHSMSNSAVSSGSLERDRRMAMSYLLNPALEMLRAEDGAAIGERDVEMVDAVEDQMEENVETVSELNWDDLMDGEVDEEHGIGDDQECNVADSAQPSPTRSLGASKKRKRYNSCSRDVSMHDEVPAAPIGLGIEVPSLSGWKSLSQSSYFDDIRAGDDDRPAGSTPYLKPQQEHEDRDEDMIDSQTEAAIAAIRARVNILEQLWMNVISERLRLGRGAQEVAAAVVESFVAARDAGGVRYVGGYEGVDDGYEASSESSAPSEPMWRE